MNRYRIEWTDLRDGERKHMTVETATTAAIVTNTLERSQALADIKVETLRPRFNSFAIVWEKD